MTLRKLTGYTMIATVFAAFLIFFIHETSIMFTVYVLMFVAIVIAYVALAVYLIDS